MDADLTVRELPEADWPRLLAAGVEPFATHGLPQRPGWRIIVAERAGTLVAGSCLFDAVHWDGWWIAPEEQRNPALVRGMLRTGRDILRAHDVSGVFAQVANDHDPAYYGMITRLGFQPAPGALYLLDLDHLPEGL